MIQANELRIGNWVNVAAAYGDPDEACRVEVIFDDGTLVVSTWDRINDDDRVSGIPLTAEILNKLVSVTFASNFNIWLRSEGVYIEQYGEGEEPLSHIKYVHQLQNLVFALTGEELEIEL